MYPSYFPKPNLFCCHNCIIHTFKFDKKEYTILKYMRYKFLHRLLIVTLLLGTVFAYFSVFQEFAQFYGMYQNIFRIKNCAIPNPITTPCFYGAFAFLIAFIYSLKIKSFEISKLTKHIRNLILILVGSNIFAGVNNAIIFYKYFTPSDKIGCSGRPIENPFTTPCFIGGAIFFAALLISLLLFAKLRRNNVQK